MSKPRLSTLWFLPALYFLALGLCLSFLSLFAEPSFWYLPCAALLTISAFL